MKQYLFCFILLLSACGNNFSGFIGEKYITNQNIEVKRINAEMLKTVFQASEKQYHFIVMTYPNNCNSHIQLMEETLSLYEELKDKAELYILFTDGISSIETNLNYLTSLYKPKQALYFLDFNQYSKGVIKNYNQFLDELGITCTDKGLQQFAIIYNKQNQDCILLNEI